MCAEPGGAARVNFNGFFPLCGLVGQNCLPLSSLAGDQVATQLNLQDPGPGQDQRCVSVSCTKFMAVSRVEGINTHKIIAQGSAHISEPYQGVQISCFDRVLQIFGMVQCTLIWLPSSELHGSLGTCEFEADFDIWKLAGSLQCFESNQRSKIVSIISKMHRSICLVICPAFMPKSLGLSPEEEAHQAGQTACTESQKVGTHLYRFKGCDTRVPNLIRSKSGFLRLFLNKEATFCWPMCESYMVHFYPSALRCGTKALKNSQVYPRGHGNAICSFHTKWMVPWLIDSVKVQNCYFVCPWTSHPNPISCHQEDVDNLKVFREAIYPPQGGLAHATLQKIKEAGTLGLWKLNSAYCYFNN